MRILHVLGDSAFGGGSRVVIQLCKAARHAGHEPAVLTTDSRFRQQLATHGLPAVPLPCIRRPIDPWHDWRGERRLFHYLRGESWDLVHTHTSKAGFIGRRAAWRAAVPAVVHTAHGFAFHERSSAAVIRAGAWVERLASRWCHRLVTVSRFHRDWAVQLGIGTAAQIQAIPNGIADAPEVEPARVASIRAEFGVTDDMLLLVSAGRLAPGKGIGDLLAALAEMSATNWRLLLPGAGQLAAQLPDLCREQGLADRVVLPGFRDDVREILAAADLAVLPTHREGLSIALLEAMAGGLPLVTTNIGSNLEATRNGEAAELVTPGDITALRQAVTRLIGDPDRRRVLGQRAREIFDVEYTEPRMLQAYLDLYDSLAPGS